VRGSLLPVARMAGKAEVITQHNLSERLPVLRTGDELETLSVALNRMIDRLDQAFQNSKRFVADASHELRTPLTVLRAELEQLATEGPVIPDRADRIGSLLEEVERLGRIVDQLFALTRLDDGETKAEWTTFDLGELAQVTVDQMRLLADDRQLEVACQAQSALVRGDRSRIKQVIVNLLDNAIKYTLPHGRIEVSVQPEAASACLTIKDNGVGISAADLPHIFDRFYRADPARSRETEGAGLGLAIAQSICLAHSGTIEAASAPGGGTRVQARFPLILSPSPS
jgi:heavy metal sensor kinase